MNASIDNTRGAASLLHELRERDTETGLLTTTRIYRVLLGEIARSDRYGNPLSCILLELGGLDSVSDDARLQLTTRLADVMRNTDFAGVWDDEQFLLVLPETHRNGAGVFAQKVENTLKELSAKLTDRGGADIAVTTRVTTWQSGDDADAVLGRLTDNR